MSTHHLYIANLPEHALMQIESYGRDIGLGCDARSVLRECVAQAWDDGFFEVSRAALSAGIHVRDTDAALLELADRGVVEVQELFTGTLVIRPLLLHSDVGAQAGVAWWQRLEFDYDT